MHNKQNTSRRRPACFSGPGLLLILACSFVSLLPLPAQTSKEAQLKIVYSASLNGNLDGCDCKDQPKAGLVKSAFYLRLLANRQNILLVDAGDILDASPDGRLTQAVLETYRELRYDALAVGEQECSNGLEALLKAKQTYPFMAQNLAICLTPDQCHLFSVDYPVFNKAGLKVGLFALTEPAVFTLSPATLKKQLKVFEPVETAQGAVSNYKAQGVDLVVLLYHGAAESARMLVKQVPGLDLVILGHEQYLINGEKIGKTWLFSPGEEGNRLGEVVVTFANKKIKSVQNSWRLFHYEQDPDDAAVRERIKRYYTERFGQ